MGQQNGAASSMRLLDTAFDAGVNFFDSAEVYALICPPPSLPFFFQETARLPGPTAQTDTRPLRGAPGPLAAGPRGPTRQRRHRDQGQHFPSLCVLAVACFLAELLNDTTCHLLMMLRWGDRLLGHLLR
jgi:hypothetical protein